MTKHDYIIGSVSSGTMRNEDLIPCFVDTLKELDPENDIIASIEERIDEDEDGSYFESEQADWDIDELFTRLEEHAPPYFYFGAHPGDGADYGFWLSEGALDDFDGLKVADLSEVPDDYTGEVLHVNDHGNASLYGATNGKLTEIWSIV